MKKYALLIAALILTACSNENTHQSKQTNNTEKQIVNASPIKAPEQYSATIAAIGDVLIHDSVYRDAQIAKNKYDFKPMLAKVKPYLERADITVANSESIVGGQFLGVSSYPMFNSPYEVGNALKDAGVDVVNMANNHTLDRGEKAIINATNHWRKLGITYVGAAQTKEEASEIKTMTVNNIQFAFLGYTYGTNGIAIPKGKDYLVNVIDEEKIIRDIERAKKVSDVVVLNIHIGTEYDLYFNEQQNRIAQLAADKGVEIVFAHHPHVLQAVKWYKGKNGNKTFVIHSLGNFLAAQDKLDTRIGAVLQLEVQKQLSFEGDGTATTSITVKNPKMLLTYTDFQNWQNYRVIPMYKLTNNEQPNAQAKYQKTKKRMSKFMPELIFVEQ